MSDSFEINADAATVCDLMNDPEFRVAQAEWQGHKDVQCELDGDDNNWTLSMERIVVKNDMPKALAKVFGAEQTMTLVERWQANGDGWTGERDIAIKGAPVTISGKFSLKSSASGCIFEVEHKAKVKVPLIGGQVEKFVVKETNQGVAADMDFLNQKLED